MQERMEKIKEARKALRQETLYATMQEAVKHLDNKIIPRHSLLSHLGLIKQRSPVVFTNGCFDILHSGHITLLAQAKALGATLVVALNSDQSVKAQNKGENRPINHLEDRLRVIAALEAVDYVTWFDEDTPYEIIKEILPNILVKGGDWPKHAIVGSGLVLENGGEVYSIPFIYNTSSTNTIRRILSFGS